MKKIFSISLLIGLILIQSSSFAGKRNRESSAKPEHRNSVSINFSEPILKLLSKNSTTDSSYSLRAPILYYGRQRSKMLYRIGGRLTMKNGETKRDLYLDKNRTSYNKYELMLSGLRLKQATDKFHIGYGIGVAGFGLWDQKVFDSGFDKVTFDNHAWSAAAGPQLLLKYSINSSLSIFTEYLLAYQFTSSYSGKKFSAFPDQNYANERNFSHGFQFDYPISIFITYNF